MTSTTCAINNDRQNDAQLRAQLMLACARGEANLASDIARRLGPRADDALGEAGFVELARLGEIPDSGYMLDIFQLTPAMLICLSDADQPNLIRALINSGASLREDSFGQARLLKAAAEQGHAGVVRALFEAGCDPNSTFVPWGCRFGETDSPLIFCAVRNVDVFEAFLNAGGKTDVRNDQGESLAGRIARIGSPEVQRAFAARR